MSEYHGTVSAFVCCDKVIVEAGNNKKTVIGIFRNFNFMQLPSSSPAPWFIYAQISIRDPGAHTIAVNIAHDETVSVVFAASAEIDEKFPGGDLDLILPAHPAVFQKPGRHIVTMNVDGTPAASYTLHVTLQPSQIGGS
jgi:hypothetical protein